MGNQQSAPSPAAGSSSRSQWLSAVLPTSACEPADPASAGLGTEIGAGLENSRDVVMDVVDFPDLLGSRTIEVQHSEGLSAQVMVPFVPKAAVDDVAQSRPTFFMQHLVMLGGAHGDMLQSTIINQPAEDRSMAATFISHGPGPWMALPSLTLPLPLPESSGLRGSSRMQAMLSSSSGAPSFEGAEVSANVKGRDYVLGAVATRGQRMGGETWKLSYFQSLMPSLAAGGWLKAAVQPTSWLKPGSLAWGAFGAWQSTDMSQSALAQWSQEDGVGLFQYHRAVNDRLSLMGRMQGSAKDGATLTAAFEAPLRIERAMGNTPYTTLTAQVDVTGAPIQPNVTLKASIEHLTLQGQGAFTLTGAFDHANRDCTFGMAYRISA